MCYNEAVNVDVSCDYDLLFKSLSGNPINVVSTV